LLQRFRDAVANQKQYRNKNWKMPEKQKFE